MWPCSVATLTTVELLAVWDGGPVVVDSTPGKMQAIGSAIAASTAVVVVRVAGGEGGVYCARTVVACKWMEGRREKNSINLSEEVGVGLRRLVSEFPSVHPGKRGNMIPADQSTPDNTYRRCFFLRKHLGL